MTPSKYASALVLSAALASAGAVSAAPYYDQPAYNGDYAASVNDYENQRDAYYNARDNYDSQRAEYERQRLAYERAQRDYDRMYGYGAYSRRFGAFDYRDPYVTGYRTASPCQDRRRSNTAVGGLLGALAGAAIGSNVAARGVRGEGTALGAVVGGIAGAAIGNNSVRCDNRGYYYSYDETIPYREAYSGYRYGRYDERYYLNQRCRLATVMYNGEWRYARVCPDSMGRYRFTG
jgi:hypothetical protein